jgi:hypothetical protein
MPPAIQMKGDPEISDPFAITREYVAYAAPILQGRYEGRRSTHEEDLKLQLLSRAWWRNGLRPSGKVLGIPCEELASQSPETRMARAASVISLSLPFAHNLFTRSPNPFIRPSPESLHQWDIVREALKADGIDVPVSGRGFRLGDLSVASESQILPVDGRSWGTTLSSALPTMQPAVQTQNDPEISDPLAITRKYVAYAAPILQRSYEGTYPTDSENLKLQRLGEAWKKNGFHPTEEGLKIPCEELASQPPETRMARAAFTVNLSLQVAAKRSYFRTSPEIIQKWGIVREALKADRIDVPVSGRGLWLGDNTIVNNIRILPVNGRSLESTLAPDFRSRNDGDLRAAIHQIGHEDLPVILKKAKLYKRQIRETLEGSMALNNLFLIGDELRNRRQQPLAAHA